MCLDLKKIVYKRIILSIRKETPSRNKISNKWKHKDVFLNQYDQSLR